MFISAVYVIEGFSADGRIEAGVSAVREGRAIGEIESTNGLSLLNVHVRGATIEPVTTANVPSAILKLAGKPLLYLGQADGTLVLFDASVDRAIYLPRNSVMLSVDSLPAGNPRND
jgi:hypothetical protein